MKKMYNQPQIEISSVQTEPMMQALNVSVNGPYTGEPLGD